MCTCWNRQILLTYSLLRRSFYARSQLSPMMVRICELDTHNDLLISFSLLFIQELLVSKLVSTIGTEAKYLGDTALRSEISYHVNVMDGILIL